MKLRCAILIAAISWALLPHRVSAQALPYPMHSPYAPVRYSPDAQADQSGAGVYNPAVPPIAPGVPAYGSNWVPIRPQAGPGQYPSNGPVQGNCPPQAYPYTPGMRPAVEGMPVDPSAGSPALCWLRGEYLLWWLKDQPLPALVTTSATQASVGRIGFPDTSVLFGGDVDEKVRQGFRVTLGSAPLLIPAGYDRDYAVGVEASFFLLGHRDNSFGAFSNGDPVLARPFLDVLTGQQRVEQVANLRLTDAAGNLLARAVTGGISVSNPSDLLGGEANGVVALNDDEVLRNHLVVGGRYLRLQEQLYVREDLVQLADIPNGLPQTSFLVQDRFRTTNDFFGGQLGLQMLLHLGRLSLEVQGKTALGITHQSVAIEGSTLATVAGAAPVFGAGGLLALPTNIGFYTRDRFTFVPEATVNLGYQLSPRVRTFVGYNFLYWSSVVRPGPQVDLGVNPNFLPPPVIPTAGPARPAFQGAGSELWVQGLNLGLEFTY